LDDNKNTPSATSTGKPLPLLEALDSQAKQHKGSFQTSLLLLRERVAAGSMLADGMREQPIPIAIRRVAARDKVLRNLVPAILDE